MEIESAGNAVEVIAENVELVDRGKHVGEAGRLNAHRVKLGLSGKDNLSTGVSGRLSGPIETGRGKTSE